MTADKLNWGVLGTGNIALTQTIPAILEANNARLYCVAGRSADKLDRFASLFAPAKTYLGYEALLADPQVDAVYIPLPNHLHREWVLRALAAKKHVLCEKPLGLGRAEVREMQAAARRHGVLLQEAMAYLHTPYMARLRQLVRGGEVGEPRWICTWFANILEGVERESFRLQPLPGAGSLYDLGCYTLSFIRFVTGREPVELASRPTLDASGVELATTALLRFDGGLTAVMLSSFESPFSAGFQILGTRGGITGPDFLYNRRGSLSLRIDRPEGGRVERIDCPNNYTLEIEQFGRVLLEGETPLLDEAFISQNAGLIDRLRHKERML